MLISNQIAITPHYIIITIIGTPNFINIMIIFIISFIIPIKKQMILIN